jgi:hypothetical protein
MSLSLQRDTSLSSVEVWEKEALWAQTMWIKGGLFKY